MKCPKWLLDAMEKGEKVFCVCRYDGSEKIYKKYISGFICDKKDYPFISTDGCFAHAEPYKESEHEFKPFDKVLVRDQDCKMWKIDLFQNYNPDYQQYPYCCLYASWNQCISYEGNEKLLGTNNNP